MDITFKGRQTDISGDFREHATAKLSKLVRLDQNAVRIDVEVAVERNPRLASQKERVELTIRSRGPAIRAEAAAEDRLAALDLALAKLDSRLRRAAERRKNHHPGRSTDRLAALEPERGGAEHDQAALPPRPGNVVPAQARTPEDQGARRSPAGSGIQLPDGLGSASHGVGGATDSVVPIEMEGDGPLVVRQKFHHARPISIGQALLEMELVGHDFYLFHDADEDMPSVVYRRRGYHYGVIRLVDNSFRGQPPELAGSVTTAGASGRRPGAGRSAQQGERQATGLRPR